jgi:SAM-dependent methyltransferase
MARCAMCDAEATATLYDGVRDHYGVAVETFRFVRCAACGSGTLDPTPPPATLAALYSPSYTFKAGGDAVVGRVAAALEWRLFYLPAYHRRVALVRRLTGLESGRVLEVGCGSGLFLRCLADAGYVVEGAETSKVDAEHARERLGLTVHHGTVEDLALPAGRFDAVLLLYVLEHIPDPARTLAEIRRILVPGGSVVLGLPVLDSGQGRLLGARRSA